MNDQRFGYSVRVIRVRKGLRQSDLARAAKVSQQAVSDLEHGLIESFGMVRAICDVLGASISLELNWHGGDFDRLVDAGHARLVEQIGAMLRPLGWIALPEFSFNRYGDRGSVDILAWHPGFSVLLIIEIKTDIKNVGELFRRLDMKQRVVPSEAARRHGWKPTAVAVILVVPARSSQFAIVRRPAATFDAAFRARTTELRRWLREPTGSISGILFVRDTAGGGMEAGSNVVGRLDMAATGSKPGMPRTKSGGPEAERRVGRPGGASG